MDIDKIAERIASEFLARTYPPHYFTSPSVHVGPGKYALIAIEDSDLTGEGLIAKMHEWQAVEGGVPEAAWDDMVTEMRKKGVKPPSGIRKVAGAGMSKEEFNSRVRTIMRNLAKKYGGTAVGTQAYGETNKDGKVFKWHATIDRQNASNGEVAGILTLKGGFPGESPKAIKVPYDYDSAFKQLGIEPR